jgi:hypothetical protein
MKDKQKEEEDNNILEFSVKSGTKHSTRTP